MTDRPGPQAPLGTSCGPPLVIQALSRWLSTAKPCPHASLYGLQTSGEASGSHLGPQADAGHTKATIAGFQVPVGLSPLLPATLSSVSKLLMFTDPALAKPHVALSRPLLSGQR